MIVGYTVTGYPNGTTMFNACDPGVKRCPACGQRDWLAHNPLYRQTRRRHSDLLLTQDHAAIVTQAFRSFCEANHCHELRILEFQRDPHHFHLQAQRVIALNTEKTHTAVVAHCPACRNPTAPADPRLNFVQASSPLSDGFYRSNLPFSDGMGTGPLLIVGHRTRTKMMAAHLKGLIFREVYN
jgi:hypothetical protein